jgi:lysozyme
MSSADVPRAFGLIVKALTLLVLVARLAACGAVEPAIGPDPWRQRSASGRRPRPGAADPGARRGALSGPHRLRRKARAGGTAFRLHQGTEGKDYIDPNFYSQLARAREAGVARGAYHFMTWCSLAKEQAAWFAQERAQRFRCPAAGARPRVEQPLELQEQAQPRGRPREGAGDAGGDGSAIPARCRSSTPTSTSTATCSRASISTTVLAALDRRRAAPALSQPQLDCSGSGRRPAPCRRPTEVDRNAFYGSVDEWVQFLLTGCDPRTIHRLGPQGRCQAQNSSAMRARLLVSAPVRH